MMRLKKRAKKIKNTPRFVMNRGFFFLDHQGLLIYIIDTSIDSGLPKKGIRPAEEMTTLNKCSLSVDHKGPFLIKKYNQYKIYKLCH